MKPDRKTPKKNLSIYLEVAEIERIKAHGHNDFKGPSQMAAQLIREALEYRAAPPFIVADGSITEVDLEAMRAGHIGIVQNILKSNPKRPIYADDKVKK